MSTQQKGARIPSQPPAGRLALRTFSGDNRGTVSIIFGLMVIPSVMGIGLAVDLGRVMSVKRQAQGYIDGAALSAGRKYQETKSVDSALAAAKGHMAASMMNVRHIVGTPTTTVSFDGTKGELTTTTTQWVRTPFSSVSELLFKTSQADATAPVGCQRSYWDCQKLITSATVKIAQGLLEDGQTLEISMMLDVTGSMGSRPSGQTTGDTKLVSLKSAAKSFIDIVLPTTDSNGYTRVALVPFANGVYPTSSIFSAVAKPLATGCTRNVPGCANYQFTKYNRTTTNYTAPVSAHCLVNRTGSAEFTEARPTSAAGTLFPRHYPRDLDGQCDMVNTSYPTRNQIMPLSNSPTDLKSRVDDLTAQGDTAGHIGTAWAWYMLSPEWAPVVPVASQPKAYSDKVKKIAVLMTDGAYNAQYCNGLDTDVNHSKSESQRSLQCTATSSYTAAENLCTNMKNKGITVYTIGFDVDTSSNSFLKTKCATSEAHHYDVKSDAAIKAAFSDIALKATALRIAK